MVFVLPNPLCLVNSTRTHHIRSKLWRHSQGGKPANAMGCTRINPGRLDPLCARREALPPVSEWLSGPRKNPSVGTLKHELQSEGANSQGHRCKASKCGTNSQDPPYITVWRGVRPRSPPAKGRRCGPGTSSVSNSSSSPPRRVGKKWVLVRGANSSHVSARV